MCKHKEYFGSSFFLELFLNHASLWFLGMILFAGNYKLQMFLSYMISSTTNLCNTWKRFWWIGSDNEHRVRPTNISWAPLCAVRQLCVKRCAAGCVYTANNKQVGFKLTPAYLAAVEIREPLNLCWRRREQPSNLNSIDFIIPSNVLRVLKVSSAAASPPPPTRSLLPQQPFT